MAIGLALLVLVLANVPASAQESPMPSTRPFSPNALERVIHEAAVGHNANRPSQTSSSTSGRRKDSILNGALIGAAIGGAGGSALLVAASGGSDDFRGAMGKMAPLTATVGFAVGAIIDGMR